MSWIQIILAGVLAVAVAAALAYWLGRRRRNAWRNFARRHQLFWSEDEGRPRVYGVVRGRGLELLIPDATSHTAMGVQKVRMEMELLRTLPARLEVVRADGVVGEAQRALDREPVDNDAFEPEFREHLLVHSNDPAEAIGYLTPLRQHALLEFAVEHDDWIGGMADGKVYLETREMICTVQELDRRLGQLVEVAELLDSAEPAASESQDVHEGKPGTLHSSR